MKKLKFTFKTRLLVLGMFLFFLFPTGIFAQQQISLQVSQEKISDVLEKIQRQTSYSFIYNNTLIDVDKPVSLSLENASISDALDRLFEKTDIGYKIVDFQITLFPKEFGNAIMSGEIVDNDNLPLAGVTIQNLRTKEVAFSDMDGNYAIEAEEGDDILFSCIGMKDRTVKAAPGSPSHSGDSRRYCGGDTLFFRPRRPCAVRGGGGSRRNRLCPAPHKFENSVFLPLCAQRKRGGDILRHNRKKPPCAHPGKRGKTHTGAGKFRRQETLRGQ